MQIGKIRRRRPTRVDVDHTHLGALGFGSGDALIENRVTPGEVGADQHDQVGKL